MTKESIIAIFIIILMLVCSACNTQQIPTYTPSNQESSSVNILVVVDGYVQIKRNEWADFHVASFGSILNHGDQIRLSGNAHAIVLCDNLTLWTVPPGKSSGLNNGCPQVSEPALTRPSGIIGNTRSSVSPSIPYILSPRATSLLTTTPKLRWNAVSGIKEYKVKVTGTNWQENVVQTEIIFPGNPPLKPGVDYLLVIETDKGDSSRDEGVPGIGFKILADDDAKVVTQYSQRIRNLGLNAKAQTYAISQLYAAHNLFAESAEMLESLIATGNNDKNIYRTLGNLYWQIGLTNQAEEQYLNTLKLSELDNDIEGQAEASTILGKISMVRGNNQEASQRFQCAVDLYRRLGDIGKANEILERMKNLP